MSDWKPASYPSVSPYLICPEPDDLIAFLAATFDAEVLRRYDRPDGSLMHAEVQIDDSVVMIGGAQTDAAGGTVHIHVYVPDAQAAFDRAVAAGGTVVQEPTRKEGDDDLRGGVQDAWGTTWWVSTQ